MSARSASATVNGPVKPNTLNFLDDNVNSCKELGTLLHLIELHLSKLTPDQLVVIYNRIIELFYKSRDKSNENNLHSPVHRFFKELYSSTVLDTLLERTCDLNYNLRTSSLLVVLNTFRLIQLDARNKAVRVTLNNLSSRLIDLDLRQSVELVITFTHYSRKQLYLKDRYSDFYKSLLDSIEQCINRQDFNTADLDLLFKCFEAFVIISNNSMIDQLSKLLSSPAYQFSFKQSVDLIKRLKVSNATNRNELVFTDDLAKLIDKCNETIVNQLTNSNCDPDDVWYLCLKMHALSRKHDTRIRNLKNLYDPRILTIISPTLVKKTEARYYYYIHTIFRNYACFNIYDERLIRFIYENIFKDPNYRRRLAISTFKILSDFKFPFIDYPRLANLMFAELTTNIHRFIVQNNLNGLRLLCSLILHDVDDQIVLDYLNELRNLGLHYLKKEIDFSTFKELNLTEHYLSLANKKSLSKVLIENDFKKLFHSIKLNTKVPKIENDIFIENLGKLQENAYLSNGLYLKTIAIYDRSIKDLISLDYFESYFHCVDQIPLNKNQEL